MILTAMHCLCRMTALGNVQFIRKNGLSFDARAVAELGESRFCQINPEYDLVEDEKDIALLVTNRDLGILDPQDTAPLNTGPLNDTDTPLDVTAFGYGYSDCGETGGDGTQRSAPFTFLYRQSNANAGVFTPPVRDRLSGVTRGDSGGPVYDSSSTIVGVISRGYCPFHLIASLLDDRSFSNQLRLRTSEVAGAECDTTELQACEYRGADYCLQMPQGARCIRYVLPTAACPHGYSDHPTPTYYQEKICAELPTVSPPTDTQHLMPVVTNDGAGLDIADGMPGSVTSHPYTGTDIQSTGAQSNASGISYIRINNRGAASADRGILVVRTDAPLVEFTPHLSFESPYPASDLDSVIKTFVADSSQSGVGIWRSGSTLNAAPVLEGGQIYYYYQFRYYTVALAELLMRADEAFFARFYYLPSAS